MVVFADVGDEVGGFGSSLQSMELMCSVRLVIESSALCAKPYVLLAVLVYGEYFAVDIQSFDGLGVLLQIGVPYACFYGTYVYIVLACDEYFGDDDRWGQAEK